MARSGTLAGGGEMGALARATDWSRTPVGPVESWPQSLRTAVSILMESKFPMLVCWGPEFIQFYNDPFRPILGVTKHPALGKRASDTFSEAWHIVGPLFAQVMHGTAVGFDDMLVPLDRRGFLEECYFVYSYSPIRDESGDVGGLQVICTETTARVVAERRLRMLRELASQASQVQDEASAWRRAADILTANPADVPFAALYALDRDGVTAQRVDRYDASLGPPVVCRGDPGAPWPLFEAMTTGTPHPIDDVRTRVGDYVGAAWPEVVHAAMVLPIARPGTPAPYGAFVAGLSPRLDLDGQYRDFLALVGDQIATAVANARAYEEEKRRTEALIELDRQKTLFFSNVSHEFRTPLTLMLGPLEDAQSRSPAGLAPAEVELVHRNAMRLLRLVNSLLDFSRIEAGRAQAAFEPVDLAGLTADLASTFRSLMEQAGLTLDVDCPPLAAPVCVDRAMWEKIVLNLLSNAFKFTFAGGVRVTVREAAGQVSLVVEDTGTGIPAADLPLVFDRFHRVEGAPARTFEGSGIGLALVRELVRMHDGDVSVASVEGRGTTFTVTVPARAAAGASAGAATTVSTSATGATQAARPYVEDARRWGPVTTPSPASASDDEADADRDPDVRILVADDNADMREYLRRLLARRWTVDLAASGREALSRLAEARPDLVISDVMMPEMDGLELLRQIRGNPATCGIPIVLLSARAGEESRVGGLAAGADDYLVKPFSARELVARVRTQLEVSRLRRETAAQNERLLSLLRGAPAAIAVVRGPRHVYEFANERYLQLVGRRDILGQPGRDALPELLEQGTWDLFDRVYATGEPHVAHEYRAALDRLGTGTLDEGYFDFSLQPLRDARGQMDGLLIHAVEVTEQVVARRQLEEARKAAEAANRAKDEFMAMLSHELRNPLAPIQTALQLMTLRGDVGAERERAIVARQVRHVVRLVDDLLDVSRIARGKIELRRERIEAGAVVAKAIEMSNPIIEEKGHELQVDVPAAGLAIDGDPVRLQQVVFNLLNNAAKYTEARGRITVRAVRREHLVEIRVTDTGIGIDPDVLPHVFDLFVQDGQSLDRSRGGLGLGLTIVRNLVDLHGGRVAATSAGRGRGSEFVIQLPASGDQTVQPAESRPRTASPSSRKTRGVRVLVVDDNHDAAAFLADALTYAGFETRTAPDGPTALQIVEPFAPHVALLDLGLPVMDGYELAQQMRAAASAPKLVAVTGYGAERDRVRSEASGFDAHLVKPVDLDELIARISSLVSGSAEPE